MTLMVTKCSLRAQQMQNLGYFPVQDIQLYIAIPEVTKNGNQLLQIRDFHIDQVRGWQLDLVVVYTLIQPR